jgi:hypothetical protein
MVSYIFAKFFKKDIPSIPLFGLANQNLFGLANLKPNGLQLSYAAIRHLLASQRMTLPGNPTGQFLVGFIVIWHVTVPMRPFVSDKQLLKVGIPINVSISIITHNVNATPK